MRVLVFRREYGTSQRKERWKHVPAGFTANVVTVPERRQADLSRLVGEYELDAYDRVVIDLKWLFLRTQARALAAIPGLVIHEFDAFWNFMPDARCYLDFERVYHRLPPFRLICCGSTVRDRFLAQGLDVHSVPKAFDHEAIRDLGSDRDIAVAFIGSLNDPLYRERRRMLERIARGVPLRLLRTQSVEEYVRTLNRIRVFVSADAGMSEYTAKNFEAMAAGCALVACRQGAGEEEELGLRDMHNVVLYGDAAEAIEKIRELAAHPETAAEIAQRGQALVRQRFTAADRDRRLFAAIEPRIINEKRDRRSLWRRGVAELLPRARRCGG